MQHDLTGHVVMVTGSARRVGRAIALGFAHAGAHVIIHHSGTSTVDAEATAADARALGVQAFVVSADIRDPVAVAAAFAAAHAHFGRLDVLVNSASDFMATPLLDITPEAWRSTMGINLDGAFYCTQQAGRLMRAAGQGGCIINIADNAGLHAWKRRPQHSVSKAGLVMLTRVTAASLGEYNIRANCLVLGPVLPTDDGDPAFWQQLEARLPLKRSGDPDDAARAAVFIAANDFITGAVLRVDGGEGLGAADG